MIENIKVYADRELSNEIAYGEDIPETAYIKVVYGSEMEREIEDYLSNDYNISEMELVKTTESYSVYEVNSLKYSDVTEDYVDVTDFGAVGDGQTDDYQAIMDAINFAVDNNKEVVNFPEGVYGVTDKIYLNTEHSGIDFMSDNATIKALSSGVTRIFEIKADAEGDVKDITINGFELDGNKENLDVERWDNWGIQTWNDDSVGTNITISNIDAHDFSGNGIIVATNDTIVKKCKSHDNWGHGFGTIDNASDIRFFNIESFSNVSKSNKIYGSGINVHGCKNVVIDEFQIYNNGYGAKTSTGNPSVTFKNGIIRDNNGVGFRTTGEAAEEVRIKNVEVSGNGGSGLEFRYTGGRIIIEILDVIDNGVDSNLNQPGAVYITDDQEIFEVDYITIDGYPGIGLNSYTNSLDINNISINNTDQAIKIR